MKRRPCPEQGSMLSLMTPHEGPRKGRRQAEPAITQIESDREGNITRMCHEPVQDPLDDPEEEAAFVAYYIGDYQHG